MSKRIDSITIEQFDADHDYVAQLARQPGGVRVVDADGTLRFTLSIPSTDITEHCDGCRCKGRRR